MASSKSNMPKEDLLANLALIRARIIEAGSEIPGAFHDTAFVGIWTVKDLFAHLIGWDHTNLAATDRVLKGKLPAFYAYHDHDWRTYNARLVRKHRCDDFAVLLENARDSHVHLLEHLRSIPAEAFHRDTGVRFKGYRVTIGRLLQAELEDEEAHRGQIAAFLKTRQLERG